MLLKNRIKKIEDRQNQNEAAWLMSLSDAELEEIIKGGGGGKDENFTTWLKALTDSELLTLRDGCPGAKDIMEKFYEYKKQNKKA